MIDPTSVVAPLSRKDEPLAISPARLAAYWNVSVRTIYRDIHKGALPAFRVGGQLRIRMADARKYGRPVE